MNDATRKLINEIYQRTHGHCYDGAAAGNFLREVTQALAARATPAQPVAQFGEDAIFMLRKQPNGERWPVGTKLYVGVPSPSGVGAAITDQKITDLADDNDCGRTAKGYRLFSDRNLMAFARALLSEAAALAEQVQGQEVGHPPCKGPNCGTTNSSHSLECQATHEAACAGGYFIKHDVLMEIIGCFQAAEIEGLRDVLAETPDERLKDLVQRRLMFAYEAALNAAPSIDQDGQKSEGA